MCLAIPGQVQSIADIGCNRVGQVRFGAIDRPVFLDFVPEAAPGDFVLVHVGFALSRIDEAEAQATYELIERLGMMEPMDEPNEKPKDEVDP
ncbi:MAG: HypC/HybG/HupF family hydrogenase formation chaperone [Bryobacteraceae bacterium]|nr:HypC/HybG/HupF family hydrogenase formation chaperone [Bryobacteraceae bacterium]